MPNIKPISDLRSYTAVLDEVAQGSPVFLTKNGRGRYVIQDISDYERYEAEETLLAQLDYGSASRRRPRWSSHGRLRRWTTSKPPSTTSSPSSRAPWRRGAWSTL